MSNESNVQEMIDIVIQKAKKESEDIVRLAERARERNLRPYHEQAEKMKVRRMDEARSRLEREFNSAVSDIELNKRLFVLQEKEKLMGGVKKELLMKIDEWINSEEYIESLGTILDKNIEVLKEEGVSVETNEKDREHLSGLLKKHNLDPEMIRPVKIKGGLVVKNLKKHFIYDYSLENLFEQWFAANKFQIFESIYSQE